MKVFRRILTKIVILALVLLLSGGAACIVHYYPQSSPESALNQYLTWLVENDIEKAFAQLDQSENTEMTQSEYEMAIQEGKYALYDSWQIEEVSARQGTGGESYVDYQVDFLDSDGTVQLEKDFTVKKQSDAVLGVLDQWKILAGHCMITNLRVTVPAGSAVYLDGEEAAVSWKVTDGVSMSKECYEIPSLLPGGITVAIRNPILESLNTTLDPSDGDVDYSDRMALKESAENACKELAVKALKEIYTASVKQDTDDLESVFEACLDEAASIVESQTEEFYREDAEFESVGIYDYESVFGSPVFTDESSGAIEVELSFAYHYIVREGVMVETGEIWADGTVVREQQTVSDTGEATAAFTMAYYDDDWHVTSIELPVIPQ
ncbi:MAG: hypothetical protein LUI07_00380 [Lachnospiraceae bacterium]|nr:hypothetical protein [Lachnospiraceae bacterium]